MHARDAADFNRLKNLSAAWLEMVMCVRVIIFDTDVSEEIMLSFLGRILMVEILA